MRLPYRQWVMMPRTAPGAVQLGERSVELQLCEREWLGNEPALRRWDGVRGQPIA